MRRFKWSLVVVLGLMVTGCASVVDGNFQNVTIKTTPLVGAICVLTNDKGRWKLDYTPTYARVARSRQDLRIICKKQGYHVATAHVSSLIKPAAASNALLGSMANAGIGVAADAVSGAMFSYPDTVRVAMVKIKPPRHEIPAKAGIHH